MRVQDNSICMLILSFRPPLPAREAHGLERKDPNYKKRGAGISCLKYTAAYTLRELAAKLSGTEGVDVN